jgi:hypothetical protein
MQALRIDSGDRFAANLKEWRSDPAFSSIDANPVSGEFGRAYYPAVFGERHLDTSFAVCEGERALVIVLCTSGERRLGYYGMPIRLFLRTGLEEAVVQRAVSEIFAYIDTLVVERHIEEVIVRDDASAGQLSLVGKQCLNRHAAGGLQLTGFCALDRGEAGIRQGLRKSFRSLVNWGQRNLTIASIDAKNQSRNLFEDYRKFHASVAGRVTRSDRSWDAMFDWIASGHGELVLGFLATGELVTGTMVIDGVTQAYYVSGVYDRERFDQPLGHWPMWIAMVHSMERGMRIFELGDLPLTGAATEKEIAIGYFKRGFATDIATWITWSWSPRRQERGL